MSGGPRVLLVRFGAIGDCVMAAWAATSIRRRFPEARLVWATESRCEPVVETERLVSRVYCFPRDAWRSRRPSPALWREQLSRYLGLRRERFDFGIDLQGHSKTALCLRLAAPRRRLSARATDPLALALNPLFGHEPPGRHTIDWNHEALRAFGDFDLPERPEMPTPRPVDAGAGPLATISVGAGSHAKEYPAAGWREVAQGLQQRGWRVAFLGGPGDTPVCAPGAVDLVGRAPLAQTMSWVAASAIHLAADTGTGHMAAAYGVPVVSVFGPTDPARYRPYTRRGRVLRAGTNPADVPPGQVLEAALALAAETDG